MRKKSQAGFTLLDVMITLAMAAMVIAAAAVGMKSTLAVYNRNGAARAVMAEIRAAQSAAVTRDGVYAFQWGGDTAVNYPQSQYRIVRDTGTCALPATGAAKDDTNVIAAWTDVARTFPRMRIQSVADNSGTAVGKIMFNSRGASMNSCMAVSFPLTVTVADDRGNIRSIQIRSVGSVRLL